MKSNSYRNSINKMVKKELIDTRNITFRLPVELISKFKKICEKDGLKMNQVIEKMIKKYSE